MWYVFLKQVKTNCSTTCHFGTWIIMLWVQNMPSQITKWAVFLSLGQIIPQEVYLEFWLSRWFSERSLLFKILQYTRRAQGNWLVIQHLKTHSKRKTCWKYYWNNKTGKTVIELLCVFLRNDNSKIYQPENAIMTFHPSEIK